jgi:hypothetical protein
MTLAVSVTSCPDTDGFGLELSAVDLDKEELAQACGSLGDIYKTRGFQRTKERKKTRSDVEHALGSYEEANGI